MPHFDIDKDRHKTDPNEKGPTFTLCGQDFECLPRLPAFASKKLTQTVSFNDELTALPDVIEAIRLTLIRRRWVPAVAQLAAPDAELTDADVVEVGEWVDADDVTRFDEVIKSTDDVVDAEDLASLLEKLMGYYGDRPTRRSSR